MQIRLKQRETQDAEKHCRCLNMNALLLRVPFFFSRFHTTGVGDCSAAATPGSSPDAVMA